MANSICSAALSQPLQLTNEFRILPAGSFKASDGRPGVNAFWNLNEADGLRLVAEAQNRKDDYLIDYEHQSLTGKTAPAAGWFKTLVWKPDGLYVQSPKWTTAAKEMISANEYRYISPVFTYELASGNVKSLLSIALTNNPALPQLTDLSSVALSARAALSQQPGMEQRTLENFKQVFPELFSNGSQCIQTACKQVQQLSVSLNEREQLIFNSVFPELKTR